MDVTDSTGDRLLAPHRENDWRVKELSLLENSISVLFFSHKTLGLYVLGCMLTEKYTEKKIACSSVMSNVENASQPTAQHLVLNLLHTKPSATSCWKMPKKHELPFLAMGRYNTGHTNDHV